MSKIIIETRDGIDEITALRLVSRVVEEGKISEAGGRTHYCWATVFGSQNAKQAVVAVRRKKYNSAPDSFIVYLKK